jgi:hypothetical protein
MLIASYYLKVREVVIVFVGQHVEAVQEDMGKHLAQHKGGK